MAAIWIATLIRLHAGGLPARPRHHRRPDRGRGERGPANGVHWLLEHHRDLIDAELGPQRGRAGPDQGGGRYLANGVQASEKVYESFRLEVTNPGGHSSLPRKDNAIYRLAAALGRLAAFDFPVQLSEVTRAYFDRMASIAPGADADDMKAVLRTPPDAAALARLSDSRTTTRLMRTTCVATRGWRAGTRTTRFPRWRARP